MIAVFDAMGTLFDLSVLDEALLEAGVPARSAWYQRLLHSAQTSTLIGNYTPFGDLAESTLRTTLAELGQSPRPAAEIADLLATVPAYPDAGDALGRLAAVGVPAVVLTNSGVERTEELLRKAGLEREVRRVFSTDEVQAHKPDPRPYRYVAENLGVAPDRLTLIAAHGWDILGAYAVGLDGIWVDRLEREWAFPCAEPRRAAGLIGAVSLLG
jgi:2-haloacid dehalogenase